MKVSDFLVSFHLIISLIIGTFSKRIPSFAGPYRIIVNKIGNVSEDYVSTGKTWLKLHTTQVRGRQPQYVWGYAYTATPIKDEMKVEVMLASRSNNQWKKNAFVFNFDRVCTNSRIYGQVILDIVYGPDYDTTRCPFKPVGLREIKNQSFEFKFPHFPVMPYGRYLLRFKIFRGSEILGVSLADIEVVPRV